jgi:hypothetical protein
VPYHGRFTREQKRWIAILIEENAPPLSSNEPNRSLVERAHHLRNIQLDEAEVQDVAHHAAL